MSLVLRLPVSAMWYAHTESRQGFAHRKANQPCQDHALVDRSPFGLIVVVADGHGSERSPKSEIGADFAVRSARSQLEDFAIAVEGQPLDLVRRYAGEELPRRIVKEWIDRVGGREKREPDLASTLVKYGSTVLAVLITERYILYLQLGDGDILRVSSAGEVTRPIAHNPENIANATTSLSMVDRRTGQPNGWLQMDVRIEPIVSPTSEPALIIVSTDGYSNSFVSDLDFEQVGPDILQLIRSQGWQRVLQDLPSWIKDASEHGSGDDITIGLIWNRSARGS